MANEIYFDKSLGTEQTVQVDNLFPGVEADKRSFDIVPLFGRVQAELVKNYDVLQIFDDGKHLFTMDPLVATIEGGQQMLAGVEIRLPWPQRISYSLLGAAGVIVAAAETFGVDLLDLGSVAETLMLGPLAVTLANEAIDAAKAKELENIANRERLPHFEPHGIGDTVKSVLLGLVTGFDGYTSKNFKSLFTVLFHGRIRYISADMQDYMREHKIYAWEVNKPRGGRHSRKAQQAVPAVAA